MKISFRQFVENFYPEYNFTEQQFKLAEQITSKNQSSMIISRNAGFQRLRETVYAFNKHRRKEIKQEIIDIAVCLPYCSSESDANDGIAEIKRLLKQI